MKNVNKIRGLTSAVERAHTHGDFNLITCHCTRFVSHKKPNRKQIRRSEIREHNDGKRNRNTYNHLLPHNIRCDETRHESKNSTLTRITRVEHCSLLLLVLGPLSLYRSIFPHSGPLLNRNATTSRCWTNRDCTLRRILYKTNNVRTVLASVTSKFAWEKLKDLRWGAKMREKR